MKRVIVAAIAASITLLLPSAANAKPVGTESCGNAYMVLPNGRCVNLEYTTVLGITRGNAANAAAQSQYVAGLDRQITEIKSDLGKEDTKEDKRDRQQTVQYYQGKSNQANQTLRTAEDAAYPIHRNAMSEVCIAYNTCGKF